MFNSGQVHAAASDAAIASFDAHDLDRDGIGEGAVLVSLLGHHIVSPSSL
jgi:hypothetical protein